jgi:hypothetical protein
MTAGRKKRSKRRVTQGLILDTNLLLVFVVGWYDPLAVNRFRRTDKYSEPDFYRLRDWFFRYEKRITTPHILAEVSNFLGHAEGPVKESYFRAFSEVISQLIEVHIPASDVLPHLHLSAFGLTDLAILQVAREGYHVLTADSPLAHYLSRQGIVAADYNDLR